MAHTPHAFPPANTSYPALPLCPTATIHFFLPAAYALLFLIALPGNSLSLWVFLRHISAVSSTHIYLSHLSISNLLLSLTTPFLAAYYALGRVWTLSGIWCRLVLHIVTPVLHVNVYISLIILSCVALSRVAVLMRFTPVPTASACTNLLPRAFFTHLKRASFARRVCAVMWVVVVGGTVPVTVYYSMNEAVGGGDGGAEKGGCAGTCYNPAVEIGGRVSTALTVPVIILFFAMYLLVLLAYMTVVRHIRRSHRSTSIITSQRLLARVLRKVVVIQVVLSACLLPYHVFKPIFISLAHYQRQPTSPPGTSICNRCHPLSSLIELKNCLFALAVLRGCTDPVMFFLLDKVFRRKTLIVLGCNRNHAGGQDW